MSLSQAYGVAAPHIGHYYSVYAEELNALHEFKSLPENLFAVPQGNGDIFLCYADGQEAEFDVIGMVIALCLEPPAGFPKYVATALHRHRHALTPL